MNGCRHYYGSKYYANTNQLKYCGYYCHDKRFGKGTLWKRNGSVDYEEEWWNDKPYEFAGTIWNMYDNSNLRVASGDYLKLTSLSLRYVVPERICHKMYMKSAYLNVSGTNLFTICSKKLKGQDPSQSGSSELINISVRPTYSLSLNVTF